MVSRAVHVALLSCKIAGILNVVTVRLIVPLKENILKIQLLLLTAFLTACVNIKVDQGDATAFRQSHYQTYAWENAPIRSDARDVRLYNLDHYLRRAVTKDLNDRGYRLVEKTKADFLVKYSYYEAVVDDQGGIISPGDELAGAWDVGGDVNNTNIHNHYIPPSLKHAHLELMFIDNASNRRVWNATAVKIIEDENTDLSDFKKATKKLADRLLKAIPTR